MSNELIIKRVKVVRGTTYLREGSIRQVWLEVPAGYTDARHGTVDKPGYYLIPETMGELLTPPIVWDADRFEVITPEAVFDGLMERLRNTH